MSARPESVGTLICLQRAASTVFALLGSTYGGRACPSLTVVSASAQKPRGQAGGDPALKVERALVGVRNRPAFRASPPAMQRILDPCEQQK